MDGNVPTGDSLQEPLRPRALGARAGAERGEHPPQGRPGIRLQAARSRTRGG